VYLFRFSIYEFFVSLDHFISLLFAFVVLGLVFSVLSQEIGWAERLQNDLFKYGLMRYFIETCVMEIKITFEL